MIASLCLSHIGWEVDILQMETIQFEAVVDYIPLHNLQLAIFSAYLDENSQKACS